jgi:hypothetical protein
MGKFSHVWRSCVEDDVCVREVSWNLTLSHILEFIPKIITKGLKNGDDILKKDPEKTG